VAEVLVQFTDPVVAAGVGYVARACGGATADGLWQGWVEFTSLATGRTIRSRRETTQPNKGDAVYWATGLTRVYLEGALQRALNPASPVRRPGEPVPAYDSPAPDTTEGVPHGDAILDPYSVYRKGEDLLRRQLNALSAWHLVNIIRAYRMSDLPMADLNTLPTSAMIEMIVGEVRGQETFRLTPAPARFSRS
jgi:hypothetical protein